MVSASPIGRRSAAWRIALYYVAMFGMVGIMMPFFPVWLESRGLTAAEIGIVLSTMMWTRALSNPVAGQIADATGERRRLATVLASIGLVLVAVLSQANGFWLVLPAAVAFAVFYGPVLPVAESINLPALRARNLEYGQIRLWGSIAFIATSTLGGLAFEGHPPGLIIGAVAVFFVLILMAVSRLPEDREGGSSTGEKRRHAAPIRTLLASRPYLLFVIGSALVMSSHAVWQGFATLHWQKAGISDFTIGLMWSGGVVAEIVLFAVAAPVRNRVGIVGLLAIGALAAVVRWVGTGATTEVWALIPLQALHGLTFGATHLGGMAFIQMRVPASLQASAQALYSSIAMGVVVGGTMMVSGALYEALEAQAFTLMALWALLGLVPIALLARTGSGLVVAEA